MRSSSAASSSTIVSPASFSYELLAAREGPNSLPNSPTVPQRELQALHLLLESLCLQQQVAAGHQSEKIRSCALEQSCSSQQPGFWSALLSRRLLQVQGEPLWVRSLFHFSPGLQLDGRAAGFLLDARGKRHSVAFLPLGRPSSGFGPPSLALNLAD